MQGGTAELGEFNWRDEAEKKLVAAGYWEKAAENLIDIGGDQQEHYITDEVSVYVMMGAVLMLRVMKAEADEVAAQRDAASSKQWNQLVDLRAQYDECRRQTREKPCSKRDRKALKAVRKALKHLSM